MTFIEIEKEFLDNLSAIYEEREAKSLTWLSIQFVCHVDRAKYLSMREEEPNKADLESLKSILKQLKKGIPIQYVLGEADFYDLKFKVNPSVLIPRSETEELVDWAIITIREMNGEHESLKILDIGTGSACIPISIKKFITLADVTAIDISKEALNTAIKNAELNQVAVKFIEYDILNPTKKELISSKYDIIISNPPYVTNSEKSKMHQNVLNHEPHIALFVPDEDALVFYSSIADFALKNLNKNGFLFLEINEAYGNNTVDLLLNKGFKSAEIRQDMYGKDRMIKAHL